RTRVPAVWLAGTPAARGGSDGDGDGAGVGVVEGAGLGDVDGAGGVVLLPGALGGVLLLGVLGVVLVFELDVLFELLLEPDALLVLGVGAGLSFVWAVPVEPIGLAGELGFMFLTGALAGAAGMGFPEPLLQPPR